MTITASEMGKRSAKLARKKAGGKKAYSESMREKAYRRYRIIDKEREVTPSR